MKMYHTVGENGCGFTNWLSPQCGVFGRVLLDRKSKSPLFPRGRVMVTNNWCITVPEIVPCGDSKNISNIMSLLK